MNYKEVLESCEDAQVGAAVLTALEQLFAENKTALEVDANERSIAGELADKLRPHFPGLNVNVDYNRMGDVPKRVVWNGKLDLVYPDIIVHVINTNTNILAIELKKDSNDEPKDDDIKKLRAYRHELGYLHALFLRLGVKKDAGTVSECEWVSLPE